MKKLVLTLFALLLLPGYASTEHENRDEPAAIGISWYSLEEAQQLAENSSKKVMIYMEASWCGYCKKMENEVFPQQDVQDMIHKYYYPVRLDIESGDEIVYNGDLFTEQEFANTIRVTGTPTYLFIDGKGEILGKQPGFLPADVFKSLLSYVGT
ncbi:MAG: thioredoxin family protein, partial [Balneolaceae bacterium]|nr:thioredoxin family protein [Balneolaceae bacterium]